MYPYMPIFLQDHINFIIAQHTYYCLLLQFSYFRRDDVFNFCRKLMSLPYLPAPHIIPAFQMLIQGVDDPVLMKLVDYVRKTSINSTVYQITSWCVIGQPIRTNNDVEDGIVVSTRRHMTRHHHFMIWQHFYMLRPLSYRYR